MVYSAESKKDLSPYSKNAGVMTSLARFYKVIQPSSKKVLDSTRGFVFSCSNWFNVRLRHEQALITAARRGDSKMVRTILERNPTPSSASDLSILLAASNGHVETLQTLLRVGFADMDACGPEAMRVAAQNGHVLVAQTLLKTDKIQIDTKTLTRCLSLAAEAGQADVIQLLLDDQRAKPAAKNYECIRRAISGRHSDALHVLFQHPLVDLVQSFDTISNSIRASGNAERHQEFLNVTHSWASKMLARYARTFQTNPSQAGETQEILRKINTENPQLLRLLFPNVTLRTTRELRMVLLIENAIFKQST